MGKRILTAVVGVPVLLGLLYVGGWAWGVFIVLLMLIGAYEFCCIGEKLGHKPNLAAMWPAQIAMVCALLWHNEHWASLGLAVGFLLIIFDGVFNYPKRSFESMGLSFMGIVYVGWSMCHLIILEQYDVVLLVYLFLAIWGSDSGAYFAGRLFGKHKLAPALSPKKTKEGAVGGVVTAIALVALFNLYLGERALFGVGGVVLFGVAISIIGQIGDLAESMLKRFADVKDSGHILPGHGGILDRFDSIIMAAPFVYYLTVIYLGI